MCVPTLPKIFRPVTRNTLFFLVGLTVYQTFLKNVDIFIFLSALYLLISISLLPTAKESCYMLLQQRTHNASSIAEET